MGQSIKNISVDGVKYYDDDVELIKIYEFLENETYTGDGSQITSDLEFLEYDNDIDLVYFGNCIAHSNSNPSGVILVPTNDIARKFLENTLSGIGSTKTMQRHNEICIM